ncbi:MAG TPA: NAD(P)H-hydrate dehydratase [Acidimicrobiia bacterium]|nr:NAD(P)H-hydrate dehydratase [Acidimicrobiia bacterium]
MLPVLTAAESARVDAASPISTSDLMLRAGVAAGHVAVTRFGVGYGKRVVVLAGPGNNGGDAYVVADRLARRGAEVSIVAYGEPGTEAARHHASRTRGLSRQIEGKPDLVIDGVFGAGSRAGTPPDLARWNDSGAPILSLDLPSGVEADTGTAGDGTLSADLTVAFHTLKPGHLLGDGPEHCGEVVVVDIGLVGGEPAYRLAEAADAPRPPRPRTAHKWSAGSVLVVGGGAGMVGAAVMAARSALRFGTGAVGIATPEPALAQQLAPEILAYPIDPLPDRFDVWVVGPGLGRQHGDVVAHAHDRAGATVIDADALGPMSLQAGHQDIVLTPHAGELRRMGGTKTAATLLRKGSPTIVEADVPWIIDTGGPELATIGSGDVLAGMIGALLARGLAGPEAARSGAYWHGIAGRKLQQQRGYVTADLLVDEVGRYAWSDQ